MLCQFIELQKEKEKQTVSKMESKKSNDAKSSAKWATQVNNIKRVSPLLKSGNQLSVTKEAEKSNHLSPAKQSNDGLLKSQAQAVSSESINSIRSTDTGVSVNTVRGVSSAKEKTGLHIVHKSDEIETLSGNVISLERNGEHA